jgi:hypothetical protein
MAILYLNSLGTGAPRTESFWQFLLHHPAVDAGLLVMFGGILIGNMGIGRMTDAAEASAPAERGMFSTEAEAEGGRKFRARAVAKYRETQPDGPFYKMLKRGQILTVVGFLIMLIAAFSQLK